MRRRLSIEAVTPAESVSAAEACMESAALIESGICAAGIAACVGDVCPASEADAEAVSKAVAVSMIYS